MIPDSPVVPTPHQCEAILRAAGIEEGLASYELVPMPDYSVNTICFLNDRYVVRASTSDGERRFRRERQALDRLRHLPMVPRVLDAGTVMLDRPAHYLLQTKLPGETVYSGWHDTPDEIRRRLIGELVANIRKIHQRPARAYVIGHYQSATRGWTGSWLDGHDRHVRQLLKAIRQRALTDEQAKLITTAEAFYAAHRTALAHNVGPRMLHGDLHLSNVLSSQQHITGIIDWEWSYGGGGEPDFDLEALFRWSLYPQDMADEDQAACVREDDFRLVIPTMLATYHELQVVPNLMERMTIYQIEHELHHMISWPPRVPTRPTERLRDWVEEQRLTREFG